jgi:hypothetical protein
MSKCGNCGANLTCGCQKRVANNGKACCQTCVGPYNTTLVKPAPTPSK